MSNSTQSSTNWNLSTTIERSRKESKKQINFKNSTTAIGINDMTQLERVQNEIGQANKIATQ